MALRLSKVKKLKRSTLRSLAEALSPGQQIEISGALGLMSGAVDYAVHRDVKKSIASGVFFGAFSFMVLRLNDDR